MSGWALGAGAAVAIELSTGAGSVAARFAGRSATRRLASSRAHAADLRKSSKAETVKKAAKKKAPAKKKVAAKKKAAAKKK